MRLGQARGRHVAQRLRVLGEHERAAAPLEPLAIAAEDGVARLLGADLEMAALDRQVRAGGEPHEVMGVRQPAGLVEVVDPPHQPPLGVAPGAEVLDVQVAHGQHLGGAQQIGAHLRPALRPAVVGGAQEEKQRLLHVPVLLLQVLGHQRDLAGQPALVAVRGLLDRRRAGLHGRSLLDHTDGKFFEPLTIPRVCDRARTFVSGRRARPSCQPGYTTRR